MRSTQQLHGMMMRPIFQSKEDYEKEVPLAVGAVAKDFKKEYEMHIGSMQVISYCAKMYIANHWEKITDWSDLEIVVLDDDRNDVHYYKYKERRKGKFSGLYSISHKIFDRMDKEDHENQNPVQTLSVVLDYFDGDMTLYINNDRHFIIGDEPAVVLADFIEQKLKENGHN